MKVTRGQVSIEGLETIAEVEAALDMLRRADVKDQNVASKFDGYGERSHQPFPDKSGGATIRIAPDRTLRTLRAGRVFRFVKPPPGWTSKPLYSVDKLPGWAAPEGYDYFPMSLLDGEIVYEDGPQCFLKKECQDLDGDGACDGCGAWLIDDKAAP